jgi:hypothetical protein
MRIFLIAVAGLGLSQSFAQAQSVEWCKDYTREKLIAYAKLDCEKYCEVIENDVKIKFSSSEGGQDGSVTYSIEIPERITGNQHSQIFLHHFQATVGYSRPPIRFGIDSECHLWGDITTLQPKEN